MGLKFCLNLDNVMLRHFSVAVSELRLHRVLVDCTYKVELWSQTIHWYLVFFLQVSWQERTLITVVEPDLDW